MRTLCKVYLQFVVLIHSRVSYGRSRTIVDHETVLEKQWLDNMYFVRQTRDSILYSFRVLFSSTGIKSKISRDVRGCHFNFT